MELAAGVSTAPRIKPLAPPDPPTRPALLSPEAVAIDSSSDQRRDRLLGPGYVDLLAGDDVCVYEGFDYPHDQVCQVVWW
jgi:hypothetical protein